MSKQSLIHSFFTKTPDSDTADSFCTHSGSTSLATSHASGTLPMHHNDTLEVQLGEKGECDGPSLPNTTSLEIDTTEFDKNKDTETANKDNETAKCDSPVQKGILPFDPGNFLDNRSKVTTQEKIAILQCIPLKGVAKNKLPTYLRKNGRKYRINYIELKRFIVYSVVAGGYICSCCMLVYPHKQALFVSEPNKCFQQISQKAEAHCVTEAHCQAVKQCTRLMNNTPTVSDVIQFQAVEDDKTRRASLVPVIQSLLWLSKRGYGIRGTVESGPVSLPSCFEEIDFDGGGLRSLIQLFAVRGDTESEKHIKYGLRNKNCTYQSPIIQNELLTIAETAILNKIADEVNSAQMFGLLIDESTDISLHSQLSVSVRYLLHGKPVEKFVGFVRITDRSAEGVYQAALQRLQLAGIEVKYIVALAVDGAAVMSGIRNSVRSRFLRDYPLTIYSYCALHNFGRGTSEVCRKMEILATAINLMYSVSSFFRNSGKRHDILQEELRKYKSSTGSMKSQSRTRFIENHKIFDDFLDNIQPVVQALSRIATEDTSSRDSRAAAVGYLVDLIDKDFVVLLCILQITGKLMASHARRLQGIALDHATAKQAMLSVVQTFTDWKNGSGTGCADNVLKNIYQLLDDIVAVVDKRIASRFVSPLKEEIKLVDVTGPLGVYLEALSTELAARFNKHDRKLEQLRLLLPDSINSAANKELESLFRQYSNSIFLDNDYEQFLMEVESYKHWINSISPSPPEPQTAYDYLSKDNSMLSKLISIYLTVPSNTATPERTFSWMRVIKNHLRNSMTDERLSAITVIYGNTLYPGIVDDIYNMFWKSQTRRLTH